MMQGSYQLFVFGLRKALLRQKKHNSTCTISANLSTWNKLANIRPEAMIDFFLPKKKPGSWYQISNIFGLLDSSEVRTYLPLRPSFIDSLIRPLVTIGFLW